MAMTGLVEQYAAQLGWKVARNNVIVEGTSDEAILIHTSTLYAQRYGVAILDKDFAVIAAGRGDDGGVDGVNRGLIAMRQVADSDRDALGGIRYRFVALFDNDFAGRNAFNLAWQIDPRVERYKDIFLLKPVMPAVGDGLSDRLLETTRINLPFSGMDWEIEDLFSDRILARFETEYLRAVVSIVKKADRTHREIERAAKAELTRIFLSEANLEDAKELLTLSKCLRGYLGLRHDFIQTSV